MVASTLQDKHAFETLAQPLGGVVRRVIDLSDAEAGLGDLHAIGAMSGVLGALFPGARQLRSADWFNAEAQGTAVDEDRRSAEIRAVAEALERYSSMVIRDEEIIVASVAEMGDRAMDMQLIPRCSARELSDPRCPVRELDPHMPIRWVKALSLLDGRCTHVPLIMSHLNIRPSNAERFWLQLSTGVAAHTDPYEAIFSALAEVVERDAIAITWLARLPLPELSSEHLEQAFPGETRASLRARGIEYRFFDATSDVGLPTLYGILHRPEHPSRAHIVNCVSGVNPRALVRKLYCELNQLSRVKWETGPLPENIADFYKLQHGARYMSQPEQRGAFEFLLDGNRAGLLPDAIEAADARGSLQWLTQRLRELGMDAFIVDLTTDELRDHGMWVIRAIVPGLLPMSCVGRARYLGHPRLFSYARRAGQSGFAEEHVNPYPQPFA